jgi:hypothetical protein
MVGTDTWVTSRWGRFAQIQTSLRAWLGRLPRNVAEKIACRKAQNFVGLP